MRSCVLTAPNGVAAPVIVKLCLVAGFISAPSCNASPRDDSNTRIQITPNAEQVPSSDSELEARRRLRMTTSIGGGNSVTGTSIPGSGVVSSSVPPVGTDLQLASGGAAQATSTASMQASIGGAPLLGAGGATTSALLSSSGGQTPSSNAQTQAGGDGQSLDSQLAVQSALQSPRPGRRFREALGVSTKFAQGQPNSDLSMLTELGVKWARDSVDWNVMEPTAGSYIEFPAAFRERLEFYRTHDIGIIYMLAYDAYTAYKATASNPAAAFDPVAFGNYAVEAAKQLRKAGVRFVLEMWNEPHNMVLRRDLGGSWNGCPPSPWVDHYVKMVKEAVERVKAYDDKIPLVTNDDMWILHYRFLEAGLPRALDGFAFHPYVQGIPERAAIEQNTDWMSPFIGVDADASFASAVRRLREQGVTKLGHTPGMWITEWGWPVNQATASGTTFSEETVAAWLPRAFVLAEAAGAENLCWFSTQDNGDGPMGLTTNAGQRRKTYQTFKVLNENFGDYVYLRQVVGADHRTSGTQAFQFWRDNSSKLIVWSVEPASDWLRLDGQLSAAKVVDAYGQPGVITRNATGVGFVPVGAAPIYLEFPLQSTAPVLNVSPRSGSNPPN